MFGAPEHVVDPTDILAHLFFAEGLSDTVAVSVRGALFEGTFRLASGGRVLVTHRGDVPPLRPGDRIQLCYAQPEDTYGFEAPVLSVEANGVQIALPGAVARLERRLGPRVALPEAAGVTIELHTDPNSWRCVVRDLSVNGVGFAAPRQVARHLHPGHTVTANLRLPREAPLLVDLEVSHMKTDDVLCVGGGRLVAMPPEDRVRLCRFLLSRPR